MKNTGWIILAIAAVGLILFFIGKTVKDKVSDIGTGVNDFIAETPIGWAFGVRSSEAKKAFKKIKTLPWLRHWFIEKANAKYNTSSYILDGFPDSGTNYLTQNNIAYSIIGQTTILAALILDNSKRALEYIEMIDNQVQAAQVGFAVYNINGKDFAEVVNWLSDEAMIEAADHLSNLRTGVKLKANGHELSKLTV